MKGKKRMINAYEKLMLDVYESSYDIEEKERLISMMESCDDDDLQQVCESVEMMLYGDQLVTESTISPARKIKEELKKLKDERPDEYSSDEESKKFIDKYYDKIMEAADILEKEPEKLRSNEVKNAIGLLISIVGFYGAAIVSGGELAAAAGVIFIGSAIMICVTTFIVPILQYIRQSDDVKTLDELHKLEKSLKKLQDKKLPEEYKKKISKVLDKIDDANTEMLSRMKVQKESTELLVDERLQMIRYKYH